MIVIVGAGLAGLVCARELERFGIDDYLLLEAGAEPGGRVRSRTTDDGFVVDHGFQVLLDSYPAARRHLDLDALEPRYFESGALLHDAGRSWTVANPLCHPGDWREAMFGSMFSAADRARLVALLSELILTPDASLEHESASINDCSTAHYLWQRGFSSAIIERFFRPFFGGVFLDEKLGTSAGLFRYYLKKFATGRTLVPARGIGQIPRQLADGLSPGKLRLNCRVKRLERLGNGADALVTSTGERIAFDQLLLATDAAATAHLLERPTFVPPFHPATAVYFSSDVSLYERAMIVLPTGRNRLVRHFVQLTNIAPEYSPDSRHLICATILDRRDLDDAALSAAAAKEMAEVYPVARGELLPVAVVTVPRAQHLQPPGFLRHRTPAPAPTHLDNIWLAGDQTGACSIQSAMTSGERSAAFFADLLAA